jgi:predicted metal-dependent hydrolase
MRHMTTKWASISTSGRLTLNTDMLDLPRDLGEFVIVHELVHLLCPDGGHGRLYKAYMSSYMPDWPDRFRRLNATPRT